MDVRVPERFGQGLSALGKRKPHLYQDTEGSLMNLNNEPGLVLAYVRHYHQISSLQPLVGARFSIIALAVVSQSKVGNQLMGSTTDILDQKCGSAMLNEIE